MKFKNTMLRHLNRIKEGYSEAYYHKIKYGITKTTFNKGRSIKLYAEELGGNEVISLNYYITRSKELLKPCEMAEQKVIHFLQNVVSNTDEANSNVLRNLVLE